MFVSMYLLELYNTYNDPSGPKKDNSSDQMDKTGCEYTVPGAEKNGLR